jgi:hypothetical protein
MSNVDVNKDEFGQSAEAEGQVLRRRRLRHALMSLGAAGLVSVFAYQNCDGGFQFDPVTGTLSSTGGLGASGGSLTITTFDPSGRVHTDEVFEGGLQYKVVATGAGVSSATLLWTRTQDTGNCVLSSGTSSDTRFVTCSNNGTVKIRLEAFWDDGRVDSREITKNTTAVVVDACGVNSDTRVVFRIPQGTNTGPWNSTASPALVFVGQTLRICNDDSVNHQLHTGGSPCAHQGSAMSRGQFYDCVIANANTAGMYDHIHGTGATFSVQALDGVALYADASKSGTTSSCATCHNPIGTSTKRGRTFAQIKDAILNNRGGMGSYNGRITDNEIRAIAFSLR